jgi:glucans biosynthesis protein C
LGAAPQDFIFVNTASLSAERFHYMDNLRALAMLTGVLFHAGLAYSTVLHNYWPTADASYSKWVDGFVWFSHLFRMPLFFLVAGFFAALMVQKRGIGKMLRNRFARVLLPFVLFWPILYFALRWLTLYAASHVDRPSPLLIFVKRWMLEANAPVAPPSMMHLWFLMYLMCFCVLVWVVDALEMQWPKWPTWLKQLAAATTRSTTVLAILVVVAPLLLVPALASVAAPIPAPESFFPQWWALFIFGFYFTLGYQLFKHQSLIDTLKPIALWLLVGAVLAYAVFLWAFNSSAVMPAKLPVRLLQAIMEAYAGLWMTLWCLSIGKQWLNRSNQALRYVADASYWVYLVHLPILFAIQYYLLDIEAQWPIKFVISVIATLAIAFASYQLIVRKTFIGRLLNGTSRKTN